MKNRIAATLLAFCMMLALLPGTAKADRYGAFVHIDRETMFNLEDEDIIGDGWKYDADACTLTLDGFRGCHIQFHGKIILAEGSTNIIKNNQSPVLEMVNGDLVGSGTLILDASEDHGPYRRSAASLYNNGMNRFEMRGGHQPGDRNELLVSNIMRYVLISGYENSIPEDWNGWEGWAQYIEITPKENDTPPVTPATYTITFDANGGTGVMSAMDAAEDVELTLPDCPFTAPEGKEFKAWSVNGAEYAAGASYTFTGNTTVTAVWKDKTPAPPVSHTITFTANGETFTLPAAAGTAVTLPACTIAAPEGKEFKAWSINGTEYAAGASYTFTGNATVTAVWKDKAAETPTTPSRPDEPEKENSSYLSIPAFSNGEIIPSARYAEPGERVTLTAHPSTGYKLDKLAVTDIRGRAVTLRELSGGSYSFIMPASRVSIDANFVRVQTDAPSGTTPDTDVPVSNEPFTGLGTPGISGIVLNPAAMPFADVRTGDWFYDSVDYVWKHYLMSGVSDNTFSPGATTTRAMIWTILARMKNVRTEVNPGSNWYERGMLWAMEQGITDGSSPMGDITREQLAAMLWRSAGSPGVTADLSRFSDSSTVSDYAKSAVNWAVANGILNGSDGKLNPQGTATRAQVAAMVMRYGERIGA